MNKKKKKTYRAKIFKYYTKNNSPEDRVISCSFGDHKKVNNQQGLQMSTYKL